MSTLAYSGHAQSKNTIKSKHERHAKSDNFFNLFFNSQNAKFQIFKQKRGHRTPSIAQQLDKIL